MKDIRTAHKRNYRREMDEIVTRLTDEGARPRLLLHACCAPCSTYCLELLTQYFDVTVLFYNPNITEETEYAHRLAEEKRLIELFNERLSTQPTGEGTTATEIHILEARYDPDAFFAVAKGFESAPEGGERCRRCFMLRLNEAARVAALGCVTLDTDIHLTQSGQTDTDGGVTPATPFDYFTTTLTISPLKNAGLLNEIGEAAGKAYGVPFLPSDFKKKNGFLRSTQLSEEFDLYRQDYCGCVFSKAERTCAKCRAC